MTLWESAWSKPLISIEERVMARVNREVARIQAEMLRHDAVIAATNRQLHRQEVEEMVMALALS